MIDKKKLKEYGFIQFNIKDVDENLYNELSDIIEEGPEKYQEDLKIVRTSFLESYDNLSNIHELLGDTNGYQIEMLGYDERENGRLTKLTVIFKSFDLAQEFRNRINKPHRTFEQCWFYNMGLPACNFKSEKSISDTPTHDNRTKAGIAKKEKIP